MAKRAFSLQATGTVDLGSLKGINAFTSFMDAWTSKAADIPILGASGTKMREQHLRLRAEVVLPTVCSLGAGADSVDAIVSTVKHLARPAQVGEARMFGAAVRDEQRIHLVPQDASCAVCGSEDITLEHTRHGVPATVLVRGLDGVREATPYKKVCLECGTVHNFNEVTVPAGKHPLWEQPPAAATEGSSAELSARPAKRRCFRPDVLEQTYFRATGKTWYTQEYMAWTTSLLESVQVSFDGMTRATRAVRRDEGLLDRVDRENLATAWFAREAVAACQEARLPVPAPDELGVAARKRAGGERAQKTTLRRLTGEYRSHFRRINLQGHVHRCTRPGRCRTAAIDGIHNLTTFKCCTEMRHYKRLGRWHQIALGCVNPPSPRSAYCDECLERGGLRTPQEGDAEVFETAASSASQIAATLTSAAGAGAEEVAAAPATTAAAAASAASVAPAAPVVLAPPSTPAPPDDVTVMLGVADAATRSVRKTTQKQRDAFVARFAPPPAQQNAAAAVTPPLPLATTEAAQGGAAPGAPMDETGGAEDRARIPPARAPRPHVVV